MNCQICQSPIPENETPWPVNVGDDYADGCHACFETQASENFWKMIDMMREPYRKIAHHIAWKAEQLGFDQWEAEEIADAFLCADELESLTERQQHWIHEMAERLRRQNRFTCN